MPAVDRRGFLGTSVGAAALLALGGPAFGADKSKSLKGAPQPPHDTLHLTWQRDPTTTMTIQWVGPSADDEATEIRYRPLSSNSWQTARTIAKPFPETDERVFRCELTSLKPGAEHEFRIGRESAEYRFRTMPAKATNEFTFVSGGDSGVGRHAQESNVLAAAQDPQFVLFGGDVAYDNGESPETSIKFLRNYSRTMIDSSGRIIPLVAAFGNHDVKGGYGGKRKDSTSFLPLFDGLYADSTYGVLDFGDYLSLVLLDSGHIASIGGEQTDWLERTLLDRQDRPHVIAVNHVPCYPSNRDFKGEDGEKGVGEDQRSHWCPLFDKYRIDLVLEHHDHTFKRTHPLTDGHIDKNGVVYLGDGSWGKIRTPKSLDEYPYLAKASESYHISVHQLQGDQRYHVALEGDGKIADVTTTFSKRAARRG